MDGCNREMEQDIQGKRLQSEKNEMVKLLKGKILLPKEVTSEFLSEVLIAIILKKAYFSSSAWAKWILLAALEELVGRSAPFLDSKSVKELQEKSFLFISPEDNFSPDIKPSMSETIQAKPSSSPNIKKHVDNASKEMPLPCEIDSYDQKSRLEKESHNKCLIKYEAEIDVTSNKLITDDKISRVQKAVQTTKISVDCFTQTTFVSSDEKETQVDQPSTIDTWTQCDPLWHLAPFRNKRNIKKRSKPESVFEFNGKTIMTFHGRPLISSKSVVRTPIIPLDPEPLMAFNDSTVLNDPRMTRRSSGACNKASSSVNTCTSTPKAPNIHHELNFDKDKSSPFSLNKTEESSVVYLDSVLPDYHISPLSVQDRISKEGQTSYISNSSSCSQSNSSVNTKSNSSVSWRDCSPFKNTSTCGSGSKSALKDSLYIKELNHDSMKPSHLDMDRPFLDSYNKNISNPTATKMLPVDMDICNSTSPLD